MNAKTGTATKPGAFVLAFCLASLGQSTLAQSTRGFRASRGNSAQSAPAHTANGRCKKLKGRSVQVFDPATGVVSGPVAGAGILDGTLEDVVNFGAGSVLTPDPSVVTYLSDLTITTGGGHLKASSPVNTFNFVTGTFTEFGNINPDTSTGRFAGATGVIFFTGKTIGDPSVGPYEAEITGEICFAHDNGDDVR